MFDYKFEYTEYGVKGILPDGEVREFATVQEYSDAYHRAENDIYDGLAALQSDYGFIDYAEDWPYEEVRA